jgi:hypothetical protein
VRTVRRLAPLLAALLALAGCGGSDSEPDRSTAPEPAASAPDPPTAYLRAMRPAAVALGRVVRGLDVRTNRADPKAGLAILRARKRMAPVVAPARLTLSHDRLLKAASRAGTMLVAQPGSEYAQASRRAGLPVGTRSARSVLAPELAAWAFDTATALEDNAAAIPAWLRRLRVYSARSGGAAG